MIDLHTHSTASDGTDSPDRIVELAADVGLSAVALTDHDGLSGIAEARAAASRQGIRLVPGCEVSCVFSPGTMHLLCYFAEDADALGERPIAEKLAQLRDDRSRRNERLVALLNELGYPITLEEVADEAGEGTLGRPHFASVLLRKGLVESYQAAFDSLLAKGGPAYIPKATIEGGAAIEIARASGAAVSLAHPLSLGLPPGELEREVAGLRDAGLVGLECLYGRYSPDEREALLAMAGRLGLVATGGSDYHGSYKPDLSVGTGRGDLSVPDSVLEELASVLAAG